MIDDPLNFVIPTYPSAMKANRCRLLRQFLAQRPKLPDLVFDDSSVANHEK